MAVCSLGNKTLSVCKEIDKLKTIFAYCEQSNTHCPWNEAKFESHHSIVIFLTTNLFHSRLSIG